jgi:hypothetical protein
MTYEIGVVAGAIWRALSDEEETTLLKLKTALSAQEPVFSWAIGWLSREDKIEITPVGATFRVRLHR